MRLVLIAAGPLWISAQNKDYTQNCSLSRGHQSHELRSQLSAFIHIYH